VSAEGLCWILNFTAALEILVDASQSMALNGNCQLFYFVEKKNQNVTVKK
jgi:hypothetical protein